MQILVEEVVQVGLPLLENVAINWSNVQPIPVAVQLNF
jgi:hypothetical protein